MREKTKKELIEAVRHDWLGHDELAKSIINSVNQSMRNWVDGVKGNHPWGDGSARDLIIKMIQEQFTLKIEEGIKRIEAVVSKEDFIDKVIERIMKKQLNAGIKIENNN